MMPPIYLCLICTSFPAIHDPPLKKGIALKRMDEKKLTRMLTHIFKPLPIIHRFLMRLPSYKTRRT